SSPILRRQVTEQPIRRRSSRKPWPLWGPILIILGFLLSGVGGAGAYFAPVASAALHATSSHVAVGGASNHADAALLQGESSAAFTVLLLGSDDDAKFNGSNPLTQSMILVRIDPTQKAVTMLSIPRDFYLPIWSNGVEHGSAKLMTAFSVGGAEAAEESISRNFNIHIDNYIWIGLQGLVKVIDTVGGVDVVTTNPILDDFYPNDINSDNPYSYKRVAVLPGAQHMDGLEAMNYVRSRHSDLLGDIGRNFRQQQVLVALKAKAKALNAADLPSLTSTFSGQLKTDLELSRIPELLPVAIKVQPENIHQIVLNGYANGKMINDEDVLIPDVDRVNEKIHQYFPTTE
ncbi:MAG: LCP family protein, partial [Candidatus Dormibacteraceae bacterium]